VIAPKHAVGIDLGTTHCAVASIEVSREDSAIGSLPLPQVVAPGEVESRPLLPSFLYVPHPSELPAGALTLPWAEHPTALVVGEAARTLGGKSALRLVSSAKSWLCQPSIDRRAALLPLQAPADVAKVSPLTATVQYLTHLRNAWDYAHPDAPLAQQQLAIGVPASFDPAARELTAEAARLTGLEHAVLIEEPQAALYSWLGAESAAWREQVRVDDMILVVDVGGGTSDFSLISVRERDGDLELERIAVGEHILLGGDNMDLALAYFLKAKLESAGSALDNAQLSALIQVARGAKERLLTHPDEASAPVVLPGRGSKLVGAAMRTDLERADVERLLLEGFFPVVDASARPAARARGALTQIGLPYAQDAAVTRHLAAFLARQAGATGATEHEFARPTALLFNGGVFKSALLAERVRGVIDSWLKSVGAPAVRVLAGADLDSGVARGAAYYGWVRAGHGIRIRGGTAMAYYVGIESAMPAVPGLPPPLSALCIAPFGLEEGSRAEMPQAEFGLVVGEPVRFRFFGSSTRRDDSAGSLLEQFSEPELLPLQDIEVTLAAEQHRPGDVVSVRLQAGVTEVGTLQLEAVATASGTRWKVELDTRDSG
jgi:molecular chaperone DnaK (HSP70)